LNWEVVEANNGANTKSKPGASVGYNKIGLNVAACKLLGDYEQYKHVELLIAPDKPSVVGVRFLVESTEKSISIKRKVIDGKIVGGVEISAKYYVEKLFGIIGTQKKTTNYPVTKDADNILVIHTK